MPVRNQRRFSEVLFPDNEEERLAFETTFNQTQDQAEPLADTSAPQTIYFTRDGQNTTMIV